VEYGNKAATRLMSCKGCVTVKCASLFVFHESQQSGGLPHSWYSN
jgi:hypothetical protein